MLQFLIYLFIFRFFFIAKGFWNFSDRWFSITAISEFAVVLGGGGLTKREMVIEDKVRYGCEKKSSVESLQ
jgi:hypothetical protein